MRGPNEELWILVVSCNVFLNDTNERGNIMKGPAADLFFCQLAGPTGYRIYPGTGRRSEMKMEARVTTEP